MYQYVAEEKKIRVGADCRKAAKPPWTRIGCARRLVICLDNALKYTDEGGTVTISASR